MQLSETRYRKVVWIGGVYDLIVNLPFALPVLVSVHLATLEKFQAWLGFSGEFPVFDPFQLLFLNAFGSVAVIWALLRITKPEPLFGLTDGAMRAVLSSLMLYYLVAWNIPQIVILFLVPEIAFALAQLGGYGWYHQLKNDTKQVRQVVSRR